MSAKSVFTCLLLTAFLSFISACSNNKKDELSANGLSTTTSWYTPNRAPLVQKPYLRLPIGAIKPKGWLLEQLKRMRSGLTGNLGERYAEVVGPRNGWLGGDGDGWERGPYWIDGLLTLAYLLDDDSLKAIVKPWVEWSLNNQAEDGYFGPVPFETEPEPEPGLQKTNRRDWWPKMVMLKVLQQHYEATGDERVITLMTKYFKYQLQELPEIPLDNWTLWANRRGGDNLMIIYWLYNITGEGFLLELAELIHSQTFPWTRVFLNEDCYEELPSPWYYSQLKRYPFDEHQMDNLCIKQMGSFHTVNMAQGIKEPVIYFQQSKDSIHLTAVKTALKNLKKYHGQPQGMYGGDEPLHGADPTRGVELCSVVELMYSLENMFSITGDIQYADHLEKLAFNALPAQVSDDFNVRQYFQSANQVVIDRNVRNFYQDVGHMGTDICFGTLTGYPCCTCNMHQGWPKFVQELWYATPDGGLAAMVYSSSEVTAKVGDGTEVTFTETTNYPFSDTVSFAFSADKPVTFPFRLRVPGWCRQATIFINGETHRKYNGGETIVASREWSPGDKVELLLPMEVTTSQWYDFSRAVERGPLVFSLKMVENWTPVSNEDKYGDYFEILPGSDWNYALTHGAVEDISNGFKVEYTGSTDIYPWSQEGAPIRMVTSGVQMPDWKLSNSIPGTLPWSVRPMRKSQAIIREIELIPYGCTTLRITEFPVVALVD